MDDEEPVRAIAKDMLSYLGYKAELAVDGDEAVTMFKDAIAADSPYVAVILDLTIPGGMGGSETVKHMREIDPAVKAIVSSGYSNDPIMADYKKYGFTSIIIKPYRINDLEDALKQTITNEQDKA